MDVVKRSAVERKSNLAQYKDKEGKKLRFWNSQSSAFEEHDQWPQHLEVVCSYFPEPFEPDSLCLQLSPSYACL